MVERLVLSGNKKITDVAMQALDVGRRKMPAQSAAISSPSLATGSRTGAGERKGLATRKEETITIPKRRERYKEMADLDLSGTEIGDPGLLLVTDVCTNVVSLSVARCGQVGDIFLVGLLLKLYKLESLDISHCPLITDKGVASLVSSDPDIGERSADLLLKGETDGTVPEIHGGETSPQVFKLKVLRVDGCDTLGDAGFTSVFRYLPSLSVFSMVGANLLTDKTLEALGKRALLYADFSLCNS